MLVNTGDGDVFKAAVSRKQYSVIQIIQVF